MWFGIALMLFSIGLAASAFYDRRRARAQFAWARERGTVVLSTVAVAARGYYPKVEYQFVHGGRRYHGTGVRTQEVTTPLNTNARRVVEQFPVGAAIDVYVNPADPQESVLLPGGDSRYLPGMLVVAMLLFGIGASFALGLK